MSQKIWLFVVSLWWFQVRTSEKNIVFANTNDRVIPVGNPGFQWEIPLFQAIATRHFSGGQTSGDSWMYPDPNVPRHGKSLFLWVSTGKLSPRIPRLNTIFIPFFSTRTIGVHPIFYWIDWRLALQIVRFPVPEGASRCSIDAVLLQCLWRSIEHHYHVRKTQPWNLLNNKAWA